MTDKRYYVWTEEGDSANVTSDKAEAIKWARELFHEGHPEGTYVVDEAFTVVFWINEGGEGDSAQSQDKTA
jgi:hypothetical protein